VAAVSDLCEPFIARRSLGASGEDDISTERCRVLMIYPRFNPNSFWNYKATCELAGGHATLPRRSA